MAAPHRSGGTRKKLAVLTRWLRTGLLCLLAGCQAVPAPVAPCADNGIPLPRSAIALRQVSVDTAVAIVQHPVRSVGVAVAEPVLALRGVADGLHKRALTLAPAPGPVRADRPTLDLEALETELHAIAGDELQPAQIQLITEGPAALTALEEALAKATCQIDVLMYLWDNDPLGWEIAHLLAARASPTLKVRVLVDGGGNLLQGQPSKASASQVNAVVCWLAQQPNVQVIRTRNPFFRFDHRKLVLVDGRLAWSGGRNFTHESFYESHDLTYLLTGPLTGELALRYEHFWRSQGGPPGRMLPPPPPLPPPDVNTMARLLRTRPYEYNLARTVYTAVDRAKHHIYLENPYFSDSRLLVKLAQAQRRGVEVRVVSTLQSGSMLTDITNRVTVNRLLAAGIRVYLYPGLTHVKAVVVDGVWAYLGTGNFDPLSLRHNRELGVAISHGPLVNELEQRIFLTDFNPQWEVHEPLSLAGYEYAVEILASLLL